MDLTPDEQYVEQERLAILIQGDGVPTDDQQAIARADVERFGREMAIQQQEEME